VSETDIRNSTVAAAILARNSPAVCGVTLMIDLAERGLVTFSVSEDGQVTARRSCVALGESSPDIDALQLMFPYADYEYPLKSGVDLGAGLTTGKVIEGRVNSVRRQLFSEGYLRAKDRRKALLSCVVMAAALLVGAGTGFSGATGAMVFVAAIIVVALVAMGMCSLDAERPTPRGAALLLDWRDKATKAGDKPRLAAHIPFGTSSKHARQLENVTWLKAPEGMSSQEAFKKVMDQLVAMLH